MVGEWIGLKSGLYLEAGSNLRISPFVTYTVPFTGHQRESYTEITEGEKELIGPGTYKEGLDEVTTHEDRKFPYSLGLEAEWKMGKLSPFVGGEFFRMREGMLKEGQSTIKVTNYNKI